MLFFPIDIDITQFLALQHNRAIDGSTGIFRRFDYLTRFERKTYRLEDEKI